MKPNLRTLSLSVLVLALSGCAADMAYRDGRSLVEKDQVEAGLLKYQEAMKRNPDSALYRSAYLDTRERASARLLEQADQFINEGKYLPAAQNFQRVLSMDPQNERARAGLRALEMADRHDKLLAQARASLEQKEFEAAKSRVGTVLAEKPDHAAGRALMREINEQTPQPPAESGLSKAYKTPITIEFREAPLKQVFDIISRRSGLNFIFDKDVKSDARTTIMLKNSTVESAIYFLLMTNQLEQQVMDANTILVYPNTAAKLKEYQETVVRTFYLSNAEAKTVANTLKTILKSRDVVADEKLNLVILRDSADAVKLAEKIIATQDQAEPEVMLDVEILEVKRSRLMKLGVDWPNQVGLSVLGSARDATKLTLRDLDNINRDNIGVSALATTLNIKKTDGDTNLLASPRIRVRNKEKAKVVIGEKVPVITTTISPGTGGFASESVSYVDVGLTLNAEPIIYLNNEVGIRIALEVSNLIDRVTTASGTTAYQIGTRQASTFLQLKDGENQVLAGLINSEERSTGNRVPGLGDLPILGRLFGTQTDDKQKTEIVLSITPHLVRNLQRPETSVAEFSAGTEANFRRKPDVAPRQAVVLPGARPAGATAAQDAVTTAVPTPGAAPAAPAAPADQPAPQKLPLSNTQPGPASSVTKPLPPPVPANTVQPPASTERKE
ncbi:secretin N-terminal domain-containing protein [Duganella sp. Root336D2]|uniref:secretin N-terminal domain-containing protein n=1 Tax=Duganella sp. Root336D2 TaxID=1736518 RepID=UPI0006FE385C|nr:secretin N-terminal domain-containing protein [Duganella sp. Root336D2]KQV45527.1 general secretion pathway protein GspD [Duganella sp. Root336D2]